MNDCDERIEPFMCRNCGRVIDPRQRFCSYQCEENYELEKADELEQEEDSMGVNSRLIFEALKPEPIEKDNP